MHYEAYPGTVFSADGEVFLDARDFNNGIYVVRSPPAWELMDAGEKTELVCFVVSGIVAPAGTVIEGVGESLVEYGCGRLNLGDAAGPVRLLASVASQGAFDWARRKGASVLLKETACEGVERACAEAAEEGAEAVLRDCTNDPNLLEELAPDMDLFRATDRKYIDEVCQTLSPTPEGKGMALIRNFDHMEPNRVFQWLKKNGKPTGNLSPVLPKKMCASELPGPTSNLATLIEDAARYADDIDDPLIIRTNIDSILRECGSVRIHMDVSASASRAVVIELPVGGRIPIIEFVRP